MHTTKYSHGGNQCFHSNQCEKFHLEGLFIQIIHHIGLLERNNLKLQVETDEDIETLYFCCSSMKQMKTETKQVFLKSYRQNKPLSSVVILLIQQEDTNAGDNSLC